MKFTFERGANLAVLSRKLGAKRGLNIFLARLSPSSPDEFHTNYSYEKA
jgi:hypothetical protein